MSKLNIFWFRQDLRLTDNPGLYEAAKNGDVLPIYILDDQNAGAYQAGGASRWWLHHSLKSLHASLKGMLSLYMGRPQDILPKIIKANGAQAVYWNRCYEPWRIGRDKEIKQSLQDDNIEVFSFNGSLLWEPWEVLKSDGTPYKVFTPFYRKGCLNAAAPRKSLPKPKKKSFVEDDYKSVSLEDLKLLPKISWDTMLESHWAIGEPAAQKQLENFLTNGISHYKEGRNFPGQSYVSRLSPYLHFGEISPNQVWYAAKGMGDDQNIDHFCSELGWREFSHSLLYYNPDLPRVNLQKKFDHFSWRKNKSFLKSWQRGMTGYPIVDAGMRELWQTGYVHNRVRMIVGSFLVKNLRLHWHEGERWFWDCLVDADLANNSASWQWIAGCGADAAPYFRIFNPVTQGQKFDPDGAYTCSYIPELKRLPKKYLFCPWEAPEDILEHCGIVLGKSYPKPIVDLKISRQEALDAFSQLKQSNSSQSF